MEESRLASHLVVCKVNIIYAMDIDPAVYRIKYTRLYGERKILYILAAVACFLPFSFPLPTLQSFFNFNFYLIKMSCRTGPSMGIFLFVWPKKQQQQRSEERGKAGVGPVGFVGRGRGTVGYWYRRKRT
jgi:hypothetical protein